jgi:TRAP-type mannitol/chloroaromatic compound transport system substrate-binding protein
MSFGRRATKFDLVWYWVVNRGDNNATMARAAFAAPTPITGAGLMQAISRQKNDGEGYMRRRKFLTTTGAVAAAASTFAAPAIAQGTREIKLVTSWPKDLPGLGTSAARLAKLITNTSGGRLRVTVFAAGDLVAPFEVFDAVSAGIAEMYHSAEYYWEKRSPAFSFFAAVPFGLTAGEMNSWIYQGGGQELWDELSAAHNIKPMLASNTGVQMGGWFVKPVTSIESYEGLRYRMPGLGGEVLRRVGAVVVNLPGGEIVRALQSGAIDASEWVGPWNDLELGLHNATKFYYYPGFHEPGTALSLGINKGFWDSLSAEERQIIATAAAAENSFSIADFNARNTSALETLIKQHGVQVQKFDDAILQALGKISGDVMAEISQHDPLTRQVYDSFMKFRQAAVRWGELSELGYLNARSLKFQYGSSG